MMICCEENEPYGPALDTATMFLELLVASYERYLDDINDEYETNSDRLRIIRITVYHAQRMDYPDTPREWDDYDGIIIPGSLSAAYDTHVEWIRRLLDVIRTEIREKRRKTLAVCFGHQAFAHSFRSSAMEVGSDRMACTSDGIDDGGGSTTRVNDGGYGLATVCSIGPMAGRKAFRLTDEGRFLFGIGHGGDHRISTGNEIPRKTSERSSSGVRCLELLYTRGDMVKSIPSVGISLCGDGNLPNEACAYFASTEDAARFRNCVAAQDQSAGMDVSASSTCQMSSASSCPMPYAITYQAHPEYMSVTGYRVNYVNTIGAMEKRGSISHDISHRAREDAELNYDVLLGNSLQAMISTGVILGWFR